MMCHDNYMNTKKIAKIYVSKIMMSTRFYEFMINLKKVRKFLQIKDNLRQIRFEWILGFGEVVTKKNHQKKVVTIGYNCMDFISSEAYKFKSGVVKGYGDALLSEAFKN